MIRNPSAIRRARRAETQLQFPRSSDSPPVRFPELWFCWLSITVLPAVPVFWTFEPLILSVPLTFPAFVTEPPLSRASLPTVVVFLTFTSPPVRIRLVPTLPFISTVPPAAITLPPTSAFTETLPPAAIRSPFTGAFT